MEDVLVLVHIVGAIVLIGAVTIATSLFPRFATTDGGTAQLLHRTTRGYGIGSVIVPLVGLILAIMQDRLTEAWIVWSIVFSALAAGILVGLVLPAQRAALTDPSDRKRISRLHMTSGFFNLLWFVVVVLMVFRPGARGY